jgi:hypothetical protein
VAARYLEVREDEACFFFRVHLDTHRINSKRRPDQYWVIERTYLKDMPIEEIQEELAKAVQWEIDRRKALRDSGYLVSGKAAVHPLSGAMV